MTICELFREWDFDKNGSVSKREFRMAMPTLGFNVDKVSPSGSAWRARLAQQCAGRCHAASTLACKLHHRRDAGDLRKP